LIKVSAVGFKAIVEYVTCCHEHYMDTRETRVTR